MEHGRDRRKYARIATDDVISIAPIDDPDRLAVAKNVSSGGIRFETIGCEISCGDVFRVTFNLDDQTVIAVGKVVWAIETDPITFDVGLEFLEVDPLARRLLEQQAQEPA